MADSYLDKSGYPIKNPNMDLNLPNPKVIATQRPLKHFSTALYIVSLGTCLSAHNIIPAVPPPANNPTLPVKNDKSINLSPYLYFFIIGLIFFHISSSFFDLVTLVIKSPTKSNTATPPFFAIHLLIKFAAF